MKRINMFYCRCIVCFIFILVISLNASTASGDDDPIVWVTSKDEAVAQALSEGKYILFFAGRYSYQCGNCGYMHDTVCELSDPPIKNVIIDNYVPWFCHVDESTEWYPYAPYGTFTLPLICRIDPRNPEEYIDRTTNVQNIQTFYNRLLLGLGDLDSDGMPDEWERQNGFNALVDDASGDADEDGLTNVNEYNAGTYPNDSDSDDDGMPDGWEVQYSLNPLVNDAVADKDSDGWSNLEEYLKGTIPNDAGSHPLRPMPWLPLLLEGD